MDPSGSELQELRRLVGELTARVFRIEQALNLPPGVAAEATAGRRHPRLRRTAARRRSHPRRSMPTIPLRPPAVSSGKQSSADLESRIGSHWLNRIGISAVLIGVSYFLKFAFDNNWIGPSGPRRHRTAGRHRHRGLEREFSPPRIPRIFLFVEGRRHRHSLSLAVRGLPGVQPDAQRRGLRHDVRGDRRHRGDGLDPGRGNPGGLCPDRRLHHSSAALHRPEPRSGAVRLRRHAGSGRARAGDPEAVAAPAGLELRRNSAALRRLVLEFLRRHPAADDGGLCHAVLRHLCGGAVVGAPGDRRDGCPTRFRPWSPW